MKGTSRATQDFSTGGVVYRASATGYEVLVVNRARHTDWSLPKGHPEGKETREEAALREVLEETGIEARIMGEIGQINYFFRDYRKGLISKSVFYYLMEAIGGEFQGPNSEVAEARWVPIEKAPETLSYANDREIVLKAGEILASSRGK